MAKKKLTEAVVLREYNTRQRSFGDIAQEYGTYANKVKRLLIKAGGTPRDKKKAQKVALKSGRAKHPTEGRQRTAGERERISEGVAAEWANASEEQREARSEASKRQWEKLSKAEREQLLKKARDAARLAATEGSKLERGLGDALEAAGYVVLRQYDELLLNPRLRIDMFLPELNVAIEVDGPSHFEPIWGQENFQKNVKADLEKVGLLIAYGVAVIRLQNKSRHLSNKMQRDATTKLLEAIEKTKRSYPKRYRKLIEIEV
jgi:very-short-patch-repair endonuclease